MGQQNYDNKLVGRGEIGINDVWHKIINYTPASQSLLNNSYKSKMRVGDYESSSQNFFALRKRLGFNKVDLYSWNSSETDMVKDNLNDRQITDVANMDSSRYVFAVSKDKGKMRIYKQIGTSRDSCGNYITDNTDVGRFVNISKYEYEKDGNTIKLDHFPFNRCVYDKFVVADRVKGKKAGEGEAFLRSEIIGNELVHSMVSSSDISASEGDYVFLYDGTYAGQVADIIGMHGTSITVGGGRAGMHKVGKPKTMISGGGGQGYDLADFITTVEGDILENSEDHKYKIFNNYGPILHFATADGIFHLHYDAGKPSTLEVSYNKYTHSNTYGGTQDPMKTVTGFCHFDSNITMLEKGKGMITAGLFGYNKFMFTSLNSKEIGADYTHIIPFQGYMLLLGPSHVAVFNSIYREQGILDFAYYELSSKKGYFSKDSFDVDEGSLIIFTNTNKLYSLSLEHVGSITSDTDLSVGYVFNPQRGYQYHEYVGELMNLKQESDDVVVSFEDGEIKVMVSPKYDDKGKCAGTKIIMSDLQMQFWYQWMVEDMKISGFKYGIWFGDHLFHLKGDKDNGKYYPTLAGMHFGEQTMFSPSKMDYVRMAIGSDSVITNGNTKRVLEVLMEDRQQTFVYDELGTTSYVQYIMKAKDHEDGKTMFDLPIDMEVLGGNGVGIDNSVGATLTNELTEFFKYNPQSRGHSNIPNELQVNKFGILEAGVGMVCSSIYSEVVTQGSDSVELLGMFVSSDYLENYASKPDNTVVLKDRSFSGPSGKALTNGPLSGKN